ncbi:DUF6160 family protein [Pseudomonas citronellolis]|uniref:DUF6160 family protein n=1 Tax=Pseudomonas citronellolis TaxID=53408 RepID=UPI0023E3E4E6|nr:DUF6160 family protein [Pseudomonas citronellolis]MDF3932728.1 DUF6160 family protein [Pseudomonas citronellolis]
MKKIKQLVLASAVLAAPFLAHADLKSMDDSALAGVTGQDGISISGTFGGSVGGVVYKDTDTGGGALALEKVTFTNLVISDDNPLKVDVVTGTVNTKPTQQLQITMPSTSGTLAVGAIRVGDGTSTAGTYNGASLGSLSVENIALSGTTIKVWGH